MKLTMKRHGSFRCRWTSTNGKCGIGTDTTPIYTYACHIETADILDQNGFIYDQLQIDEYFQKKYNDGNYRPALSCEKLAVNAVNDIKYMIESHMLKNSGLSVIYKIAVTIGVDNGNASMTAEWVPEAIKPVGNVKRVKRPVSVERRMLDLIDDARRNL